MRSEEEVRKEINKKQEEWKLKETEYQALVAEEGETLSLERYKLGQHLDNISRDIKTLQTILWALY